MPGPSTVLGQLDYVLNKEYKYNLARLTAASAAHLTKFGTWITAYSGFIPPSVVAVRIEVETGGRPSAGPVGAGKETGLLQLWLCRKRDMYGRCVADCGYSLSQARDPQLNLKCMLPMWQGTIKRIVNKFYKMGLLKTRNFDYWAIVQLTTMIGEGAMADLLRKSKARPGREYRDVFDYVKRQGESLTGRFGSQSRATIARRVAAAGRMTEAAAAIGGLGAGAGGLIILAVGGYFLYRWLKKR